MAALRAEKNEKPHNVAVFFCHNNNQMFVIKNHNLLIINISYLQKIVMADRIAFFIEIL